MAASDHRVRPTSCLACFISTREVGPFSFSLDTPHQGPVTLARVLPKRSPGGGERGESFHTLCGLVFSLFEREKRDEQSEDAERRKPRVWLSERAPRANGEDDHARAREGSKF